MIAYDPRYHTFQSWSALMCEAYADQQLMISGNENDWIKWAEALMNVSILSKENIPSPRLYDRWDKWATALVNSVGGGA